MASRRASPARLVVAAVNEPGAGLAVADSKRAAEGCLANWKPQLMRANTLAGG